MSTLFQISIKIFSTAPGRAGSARTRTGSRRRAAAGMPPRGPKTRFHGVLQACRGSARPAWPAGRGSARTACRTTAAAGTPDPPGRDHGPGPRPPETPSSTPKLKKAHKSARAFRRLEIKSSTDRRPWAERVQALWVYIGAYASCFGLL